MLVSVSINRMTGRQRMVEDLTRKISARSEAAVWARVKSHAVYMDPAQARGYIRARAALVLNRELAIATRGLVDVTERILAQVKQAASDAIVRQAMAIIAMQHPAELLRAA
jgi:hypothetical protein